VWRSVVTVTEWKHLCSGALPPASICPDGAWDHLRVLIQSERRAAHRAQTPPNYQTTIHSHHSHHLTPPGCIVSSLFNSLQHPSFFSLLAISHSPSFLPVAPAHTLSLLTTFLQSALPSSSSSTTSTVIPRSPPSHTADPHHLEVTHLRTRTLAPSRNPGVSLKMGGQLSKALGA
jgi:hypothetical protein